MNEGEQIWCHTILERRCLSPQEESWRSHRLFLDFRIGRIRSLLQINAVSGHSWQSQVSLSYASLGSGSADAGRKLRTSLDWFLSTGIEPVKFLGVVLSNVIFSCRANRLPTRIFRSIDHPPRYHLNREARRRKYLKKEISAASEAWMTFIYSWNSEIWSLIHETSSWETK